MLRAAFGQRGGGGGGGATAARSTTLLVLFVLAAAEPNGLARVPQMGWNSWNYEEHFCEAGGVAPSRCLNETFMVSIVDAVAGASGMAAAGYDIINLSEAWPAPERAANGSLVGDLERFPHGIAWLADYVHARGLRFGIYLDVGEKTCAGFPGSLGHEELDVATIVGWGADYVWLDGCNFPGNASEYLAIYERWGTLFNSSGRGIVWEDSLPAYSALTKPADLQLHASFSHEFRFYDDIRPDFGVILGLVDYMIENGIQEVARPGQWPLLDMLEVGNPGLSLGENRAHFALWAMLAQPLHAGNDVASMSDEVRGILTNAEVIAVDQDPLGRAGWLVADGSGGASCGAEGGVVRRRGGGGGGGGGSGSCPAASPAADACAWNRTAGGYFDTARGAAGNLGQFGPNVALADAEALCCANALCAGISYSAGVMNGSGFLKRDFAGPWMPSADFDGYDDLARANNASGTSVFARLLADASVAVLLLNRGLAAANVCAGWADVGLNEFAYARVRDLFAHADVGPAVGQFCADVPPHDVVMLRVQQ